MSVETDRPDIEAQVKLIEEELTNRLEEYEHQRILSVCLKDYLENQPEHPKVLVLPPATRKDGRKKSPDIVLAREACAFLDLKRTLSTQAGTLIGYLDEMQSDYGSTFRIPLLSYDASKEFSPEIGALFPIATQQVANMIEHQVSILLYEIEQDIRILACKLNDSHILLKNTFEHAMVFPQDVRLVSAYRILNSEVPLTILAESVYTSLFANRTSYLGPTFEVSRETVENSLNSLCPPYLCTESAGDIRQFTKGRVDRALRFLHHIGMVDISERKIVVFARKGSRIPELRRYLIRQEAIIEAKKRRRKVTLPRRERVFYAGPWNEPPKRQSKIEDFGQQTPN